MPYVDTGKLKLHYVEHGAGDNVVVFVHGNPGSVEWMDLVWPHLPHDLRVIAYDWRGCGHADEPAPAGYGAIFGDAFARPARIAAAGAAAS